MEFGKLAFIQVDKSLTPILLAKKLTIRKNNSIIPKKYTNAVKSLKKNTTIPIKTNKIIKSILHTSIIITTKVYQKSSEISIQIIINI